MIPCNEPEVLSEWAKSKCGRLSVSAANKTRVYVGTYTQTLAHVAGKAVGIYIYELDHSSGALRQIGLAPDVVNPSFLTVDRGGRHLYAVSELKDATGRSGGEVSAFAIDPSTGGLSLLNKQSSHGGDPCHVTVDATSSVAIVVNHENGPVAAYPVQSDGRPDESLRVGVR